MIEKRFTTIDSADDFVCSEEGVLVLDAIAMRLQVVGELLKKINKMNSSILDQYSEINWDNIIT